MKNAAMSSVQKKLNERADNYRKTGFMRSSLPVVDFVLDQFGFGSSAKSLAKQKGQFMMGDYVGKNIQDSVGFVS